MSPSGRLRGGVGDPRLVRDGVFTLGSRVVGVWHGGSLGPGGGVGGRVVSGRRKAPKVACPPLMVRICIGPCGEGANCTLHLVSSGRRSEFLGLPLGRFVAVAACTRVVRTPATRLVIVVMRKPCLCLLDFRLLEGAVFWVPLDKEFFHKCGSFVVFDAARSASCKDTADAYVFAIDVAASKRLSCGECLAFEVGFSFVRLPSSGRREV